MNPTPEQIEQCARVCYAAQRELLVLRGREELPLPWHSASESDKQAARERVFELWHRNVGMSASLEDQLAQHIVRAFAFYGPART